MGSNVFAKALANGGGASTTAKASTPNTSTDQDLRTLLEGIKSNQDDFKRAQDLVLRRLENIELNHRGILTSQRQTTEHLHRLQTAQHQLQSAQHQISDHQRQISDHQRQISNNQYHISDQVETAVTDVRLHRQDFARQHVRFPLNAGKRVTETTELLERILVELPMKDVLFALRVSRRFQEVIKGSTRLQCKLYIHAETPQWTEHSMYVRINPLLSKAISHKYMMIDGELGAVIYDLAGGQDGDTYFVMQSRMQDEQFVIKLSDTCPDAVNEYGTLSPDRRTITKSIGGSESWRWMFLTQPPIDIETVFKGRGIDRCNGIKRLGDLADEFHSHGERAYRMQAERGEGGVNQRRYAGVIDWQCTARLQF